MNKENKNNKFANKVQEFLSNLAENEIIQGKKYDMRIPINDGGENSYVGLCIYTEDFMRKKPVTSSIKLFRHSNSVSCLSNTWGFELGGVCHVYADNPDIPMCFESYGVTVNDAETEAAKYFNRILQKTRKQTSDYKIKEAETVEAEKQKLLARLSELEDGETT